MARFSPLIGADRVVGEWVRKKIPGWDMLNGAYRAIGLCEYGRLVAGVVYTDCSAANLLMHVVIDDKKLTRGFVRLVFGYPFNQLKLRRVTACVPAKNGPCRLLCSALGFTPEGTMERAMIDDDLIIYRMFREECRWVNRAAARNQ